MNKIILFTLAILFFSCSNNTNNPVTQQANIPEEEKKLRDAISSHPDSLLLKENLVQYFRENNNYSEAIAETDKAIQKDSANEKLWYMKATLHFENEDTTKAIDENAWFFIRYYKR
jgi:predicted Zn-dependent protease